MPEQIPPPRQIQRQPQADIDLLSLLSPEELQELLGLGTFGARAELLEGDMQRAQALQQPGAQRSTPIGAALGGVANAIGAVGGSTQADMIRGKQQSMLDDQDQRRMLLAELMRRQRGAQQYGQDMQDGGAGDVDPSMMFRLG